jgi:hypothetical protein
MATFQSGGAFLPNGDANISGAWNFQTPPTIGGSASAAGTTTVMTNASGVVGGISTKTTTIANGAATALFDVARSNNVAAGGTIEFMAVATDGTDYQNITGTATYSFVDKAGTGTFTITDLATSDAKAVSTGTYTLAWTFVTGTAKGTVKLQPTSSLTATTHTVTFTVYPLAGAITLA